MKLFLEIDYVIWHNFCIEHFDQRSKEFKLKIKFISGL
jgi:hypothetical protein